MSPSSAAHARAVAHRPTTAPPPAPAAAPSAQAPAPEPPAKKKGKGRLLLIVGVALVVVLGGAFFFKTRMAHASYGPGHPVPAGKVLSLGTLTMNTADGHIVQAGIALQMTAAASTKTETTDRPALLNAVIQDFGSWTYGQLITPEGRASLQAQLLASFQKILGTVDKGVQQVSGVYFTSFVAQ